MHTLWIRVVDSMLRPVDKAVVRVRSNHQRPLALRREEGRWMTEADGNERITVDVTAEGFQPETHSVMLRAGITQALIGLRRGENELTYVYGDDRRSFQPSSDELILRIQGDGALKEWRAVAKKGDFTWSNVGGGENPRSDRDMFIRIKGAPERVRAAAQTLRRAELIVEILLPISHGNETVFGLPGELVVRFEGDVKPMEVDRIAENLGFRVERAVRHAGNAYLLSSQKETSYDVLKAAESLVRDPRVRYVEPNLRFAAEADDYTPNDPLWSQLSHLTLINADGAWDVLDNVDVNLRGGSPDITIGVIDLDGVSPDHPDLTATLTDGTSKLVSSMDFSGGTIITQTAAGLGGDHGTQCAGSATAAFDNSRGISGVAPNCHLVGAQIGGASDTVRMADIYLWVGGFLNGSTTPGFPATPPTRPADVISSSWGSTGLALSNTIRDCFDYLVTHGRGGKGCVLCFSLGNSGYVDFTNPAGGAFRAWPTYEKIIAVGSSIDTGPTNPVPVSFHADPTGNTTNIATAVDRRSLFSPFGPTALRKPDLVAPSHTAYDGGGVVIDPILSTVRVGTGAVNGCTGGGTCNDYATSFGGTSHSTPTVAGGIALLLSARPSLNWIQVRDVLRASSARIDAGQTDAIGAWQDLNADGAIDYSQWYGAGRLDLEAAINLAFDPTVGASDIYVRENLADIGAVPSIGNWWNSPDIWVRRDASTAIPTLAWSDPAPHEHALRGQDNAVFCRVRNIGAGAASSVYVRALLTHWAGLEFVYPDDFAPSTNAGAALPSPLTPGTYLLGETRLDNVAFGESRIVKFVWPQSLIPPETVTVEGASVRWHPCLLVETSPHDGPASLGTLPAPVQGNNNIAQRNITINNVGDSDADTFIGMIAGTRRRDGIATLILDATELGGDAIIRVRVADAGLMKDFISAVKRLYPKQGSPGPRPKRGECGVIVEERTRLRVDCGPCSVVIDAAPGSRILSGCSSGQDIRVSAVQHQDLTAVEFRGLTGRAEVPLRLPGGVFVPLLVSVDGGEGDLTVTQRRGDGEISGGYGIRQQTGSSG